MEKIRGVNLGNWLVLEKWMDNNLFSGTQAMDETYLCAELGHDRATERLKVHRDEFITERDFEEIAFMGFNAVRIPVPFFLFEDLGPYVHCYEYLDKAFKWSEKYGLKILVELHTVPGGHNGTDNAGICGICIWSTRIEQVNYALWVLEKIAERYGKREALWGIGVLNEPMCCDIEGESRMIANAITCCRILISMLMFLFSVFSPEFYVCYLIAGISDMIDGTIVRKLGTSSKFGEKLDTVADFVFAAAALFKLLPVMKISMAIWIWTGLIAVIIYNDFVAGYESGMTMVEIAKRNNVSERTIYRYKAYYDKMKEAEDNE